MESIHSKLAVRQGIGFAYTKRGKFAGAIQNQKKQRPVGSRKALRAKRCGGGWVGTLVNGKKHQNPHSDTLHYAAIVRRGSLPTVVLYFAKSRIPFDKRS